MARVKGGLMANKRRKNILERAKGFRHGRSTKVAQAHEALLHAGKYAFNHRKDKKTDFRQLWIVRLNAALRENGLKSYSTFINMLKVKEIGLNRKVLSEIAANDPELFARVLKKIG